MGAWTTALMVGLLLPHFAIGIPDRILTILGVTAAVYGFYSIGCFILKKNPRTIWLRIILIANLIYCAATFCIVLYYLDRLSTLGLAYFSGELLIILTMGKIEAGILKGDTAAG